MTAVVDVGEHNFAQEVVEASRTLPVVVDFWAGWCGPCKVLGPLLERLAEGSRGAFKLAKVDTEKEPGLAALFQVQSIPFVVAFKNGRPADAFVGARDEVQLRAFLSGIGVDLESVGEPTPESPGAAALRRASSLLSARQLDDIPAIRRLLAEIEEDDDDYARAERLAAALPWFEGDVPGTGAAALAAQEARVLFLDGEEEAAMRRLLDSVQADREWQQNLARKALVALMQLYASRTELVAAVRRRLAGLLY